MSEPMTDEQRAEIRDAAQPGYADILAQLIKHGAHDDPKHGKVIVHGVTVVPAADLKAAVRVVWYGAPALLAEVERLRTELDLAFSPGMYLDIQKVLDDALGTNEADGAGEGIVADVALIAGRMKKAEAERDDVVAELKEERLTSDALRKNRDQLNDELTTARAEAARLAVELEDARTDRKTAEMQRDDYRKAHKASVAERDRLRRDAAGWRTAYDRLARHAVRLRGAWQSARRGRAIARGWYEGEVAERDRLAEQVKRVRALHYEVCSGACGCDDTCECGDRDLVCAECNDRCPCPTIRAVDGTEATS